MPTYSSEVTGYDLSSTGTVIEYGISNDDAYIGYFGTATASVDYVLEVRGRDVGWTQVDTASGTTIDGGKNAPEAHKARLRNTTTASGTADVVLGSA